MRKAAVLALLLAVLPACSYFLSKSQTYRPKGVRDVEKVHDGRTLYMSDCAWCHGSAGEGTPRGPNLATGANGAAMMDFMLSTGRMPIDHPDQPARRRDSVYSQRQIEAIVRFTDSFNAPGPGIPHPDPEKGDFELGVDAYQDNCAACHAPTGIGGALSSGNDPGSGRENTEGQIATPLDKADARQIAEAMLVGPGPMPVFGSETLTKKEVDSIVRYVLYLQEPDNRGGLPMGRVGPWSEGAAGWLVGLGSLLVLIRWIGEKRERPGRRHETH
ncbi:MAG: c-type cytochrome [Actinomycetota bacterium]